MAKREAKTPTTLEELGRMADDYMYILAMQKR